MYSGTGMYALGEAARLTGIPVPQLNRWLFGYHYPKKRQGESIKGWSEPLWIPQLSGADFEEKVIGFHDLLEARFVNAFVRHGVPLIVVRRCLESAQQMYGVKYPFTTLRFRTDGKTIFGEAVRQAEKDGVLVDLRSRQHVFREIISPSLYAGIEYREDRASKWYPSSKREHVVLDPSRQFGAPIIEESGTPTDVIYAAYLAEGGTDDAIRLTSGVYGISPRFVRSAVRFESSLRQAH